LSLKPGERMPHTSALSGDWALHISDVQLANLAFSEQSTEIAQTALIAGHNDQTGCVPVEAMHQAKLRPASLQARDQ
jgi:hypothetical protein